MNDEPVGDEPTDHIRDPDSSAPSTATDACRAAVTGLLQAIESRDLRAIGRHLSPGARWQVVPHPPAHGRAAVIEYLAGIVTWSDDVRWDVITASYGGNRAWVERVDRFLLDGDWHDVRCNGVVEVDDDGLVSEVRDYVDLGEWRDRVRPALDRLATRPAAAVVARHLDAVQRRDAVSMAADYALDARLVRGSDTHVGWDAIADYFDSVPSRLAGRTITFDDVAQLSDDSVRCRWAIADGTTTTAGVDTFVVAVGRIVEQTVSLHGDDF